MKPVASKPPLKSPRFEESGFTLLELVIVTALFALLTLIVYSTLNSLTQGKKNIEAQVSTERMARYLIQRMTRELMSHVEIGLILSDEDGNLSSSPIRPFLIGTNATVGDTDRDSLQFVSANSGQTGLGAGNYGNVQISYRLVPTNGSPEQDPPLLTLIRDETPAGVTDPQLIKQSRVSLALARNVVGLNFRFLKDKKWRDDWAQIGRRLPDAVEITLKFKDDSGQIQSLKTAVAIQQQE